MLTITMTLKGDRAGRYLNFANRMCVCVCVCVKMTEPEWTGQVCDVPGKKPECVAPHASM